MKISNIILLIMIIVAIVAIYFILSKGRTLNENCYNMHLQECLNCHSKNLSYALCSGVCFEPREIDFEIYCAFHPQEGCQIPHACIT